MSNRRHNVQQNEQDSPMSDAESAISDLDYQEVIVVPDYFNPDDENNKEKFRKKLQKHSLLNLVHKVPPLMHGDRDRQQQWIESNKKALDKSKADLNEKGTQNEAEEEEFSKEGELSKLIL